MGNVDIFKFFNISVESEDIEIEKAYLKLKQEIKSEKEKTELLENYNKISTKEKRYLYSLTSLKGFKDITDLDKDIIAQPNYIGPRQWLELI